MVKADTSNCVACMLRPLIYIGLLATTPLKCSCRHSSISKSHRSRVERSRFWRTLCLLMILAYVVAFVLRIRSHHRRETTLNYSVKDLFWYITYMRIILITFLGNTKSSFKVVELNGLIAIFEERSRFAVRTFADVETVALYRNVTLAVTGIIGVTSLAYFVMDIVANSVHEILETIIGVACSTIYMVTAFHFLLMSFVYSHVYDVCFQRMKKCMLSKFRASRKPHVVELGVPVEKLVRLARLYSCIHKNFAYGRKYSGHMVVMSFNMFAIMFVFNFFLLALQLVYGIEIDSNSVILQLETIASLLILTVYLFVYDNLSNMSQDITSFLFRYPISRLGPAEAAQVEMLITTLQVQRPIMKPCDILTVGVRLLASMSGTVVTYVLVALQFHASWTKD